MCEVFAQAPVTLSVPLNTVADVEKRIDDQLTLHVTGSEDAFKVEVRSDPPTKSCWPDLLSQAAHGPDENSVMPWQLIRHFYPDVRSIPVCGHPLHVDLSIENAKISGDGDDAKFIGGELKVVVRETFRVRRTGSQLHAPMH